MVMHARKPQRINDGYFEKHQAHPYQKKRDGTSSSSSTSSSRLQKKLSSRGSVGVGELVPDVSTSGRRQQQQQHQRSPSPFQHQSSRRRRLPFLSRARSRSRSRTSRGVVVKHLSSSDPDNSSDSEDNGSNKNSDENDHRHRHHDEEEKEEHRQQPQLVRRNDGYYGGSVISSGNSSRQHQKQQQQQHQQQQQQICRVDEDEAMWNRHCQGRKDDDYHHPVMRVRTFKDANSKYSSSKGGYSSSATSDSRYEGRMRDSPNGNSYSPAGGLGLGMAADRDSPRSYSTKPLYKKERENRDYKLSSSRDKYSDCTRSPKDKRSRESRDSEHRTNHDRSSGEILHPIKLSSNSSRESSSQRKPTHNSCQDKRGDERGAMERTARFGDWSEHMSSSGKKYYYNCKTEVSQWEKPREWIVRTESRQRPSNDYSSSRSSGHDKHSNSRSNSSSTRESSSKSSSSRQSDKRNDYWGSSGTSNRDDIALSLLSSSSSSLSSRETGSGSRDRERDRDRDSCRDDAVSSAAAASANVSSSQAAAAAAAAQQTSGAQERQAQDMDISPGDSTPTSETIVTTGPHDSMHQGPVLLANALPRLTSHPTSTSQTQGKLGSPTQQHGSNAPGPPVSLQNLPRLLSQITGREQPDAQKALQTIQTAILLSRQSGAGDRGSCASDVMVPLKVDTSNNVTGEGPPTPTHSETQDCLDARKLNSPVGANSVVQNISSLQSISTLGTLGSLGNGGLQALSRVQPPLTPSLTPSLANHYREDLTQHVRAFPADILEKQAQKLSEEAHTMGSLQCTRVSAELKTARSIVRLTEIQATLQEQRILFLRQQIQTLEELKSQNSFMSDDS